MVLSNSVSSPALMLSPDKLIPFLTPFAGQPLRVAFSGGIDSTVLLYLLVQLRDQGVVHDLCAIHVNHGLSSNANDWTDHCRQLCQQWSVPLVAEKVVLKGLASIEQEARDARYRVFENQLSGGGCLLMGHHRDDQAETLLFRLFRGAGLDGLAGIPASRRLGQGTLVRPLLGFSRQQIEAYAKACGLGFVEDESNQDERFARNYLRQSLIPQIERQWAGVSARLAALSDEAAENKKLVDGMLAHSYQQVAFAPPSKLWGTADVIDLQVLESLDGLLGRKVIRYWLEKSHCPMPDRKLLDILFTELIGAGNDAEPVVRIADKELRRYQGKLVIMPVKTEVHLEETYWNWQSQPCLSLVNSTRLEIAGAGSLRLPEQPVNVRFRGQIPEGCKVRVAGRKGSKTIKRWLQEYQVPPWLREQVPFLFAEDVMVAAADLWICDGFRAEGEGGCSLTWLINSTD